ncbi:hypothetical protein LWX53_01340 [bacterium]|nr:hypothetical protein [bacterium]
MRIAVVALSEKKSESLLRHSRAVAREFTMMGNVADSFEAGDSRVSSYDFIVVCSEAAGLVGKIGPKFAEQLARCGNLVGRRSMALLVKAGLFPGKALSSMMRALEKEGMVVTMAEIVSGEGEAAAAAREAPLTRS